MSKDEAFVRIAVKCPICGIESHHRYVKSKLYTEDEVEGDQHVVSYKWENPKHDGIRPNFYYVWHCPNCHFCDDKEVFRGRDDCGGKLELIQEKLLISGKIPNSIIKRLGAGIEQDNDFVTLESALSAHLLATFIQEMLSPNMRQYSKLGRLYLRIAWLYREKASWNIPESGIPEGCPSYEEFFRSLKPDWENLPLNEAAAMDTAIVHYETDLSRSRRVDDVKFEVNVLFLLLNLHVRRERLDEALKCVRSIFQMATTKRQTTRQLMDKGVRSGKLDSKRIESMRSLITWLNHSIDRATSYSEKLNDVIFRQEYAAARETVISLGSIEPKQLLLRLREDGFHEITCRRVATMYARQALKQNLEETGKAEEEEPKGTEPEKNGGFWRSLIGRKKTDD